MRRKKKGGRKESRKQGEDREIQKERARGSERRTLLFLIFQSAFLSL